MTLLAATGLPAFTSHLGVSGMKANSSTPCSTAGTAPSPTIQRQPSLTPTSPHPATYAATWPSVTHRTFSVTRLPRWRAGASSATYRGVAKLAAPTAAPTTARPATIPGTVELRACRAAPAANSRSAARITGRRPKASARTEAKGEAKSARSDVLDVMRDLSREVRRREEREGPMETSVAEITPVSSVFGGGYLG